MAGRAGGLAAVGTALYSVAKAGFAYNNAMEQNLQGLTALSVATQNKSIPVMQRYATATKEATATMAELQKINVQTPHTLDQTNKIYKAMYVSMKNVGASTDDMVELTRSLSIASGAAGIEFNSLLAGVDGLASGTVLANSDLGRFLSSLGLTNEALKNSTDKVALLNSALEDFKAADTMNVAVSNLTNAFDKLAGRLTKPMFELAKDGANELADAINGIDKATSDLDLTAIATMATMGNWTGILYQLATGGLKATESIETLSERTERYTQLIEAQRIQATATVPLKKASNELIEETAIFLEVTAKSLEGLTEQELQYATQAKVSNDATEKSKKLMDVLNQSMMDAETADMAYYQAQINLLEVSIAIEEQNKQETEAIIEKTKATEALAQATSWLYDAQGNLRDTSPNTGSDGTWTSFTPANNVFGSFTSEVSESVNVVDSFNTTISNTDDTMQDFQRAVSDVTNGLGTGINSLSSMIGGSSLNEPSFIQSIHQVLQAQQDLQLNSLSKGYSEAYKTAYFQFTSSASDYLGTSSNFGSKQEQAFAQKATLKLDAELLETAEDAYDVQEATLAVITQYMKAIEDGYITKAEASENERLLSVALAKADTSGLYTGTTIGVTETSPISGFAKDTTFTTADGLKVDNEVADTSSLYTGTTIGVTETAPISGFAKDTSLTGTEGVTNALTGWGGVKDAISSPWLSTSTYSVLKGAGESSVIGALTGNDSVQSSLTGGDSSVQSTIAGLDLDAGTIDTSSIDTAFKKVQVAVNGTEGSPSLLSALGGASTNGVGLNNLQLSGQATTYTYNYGTKKEYGTDVWGNSTSWDVPDLSNPTGIASEATYYAYYKQGGYTGDYGVNQEAGIVHGQEYVVNAQTTRDLGLNGSGGVFQSIDKKLDMLAHLYEINLTSKQTLSIEKEILYIEAEREVS